MIHGGIMKKLFLLFSLSLLLVGMVWGANLVDENIQSWTTQGSYGTYTQTITAGTVNMANCIVQPGATASGVATAGRVQVRAATGILELPELSSIGTISFNLVAGGANRTLKLQKLNGATWEDITTISGIGNTGDTFSHALNTPSATQIRLASASSAVYVHDILVTDYTGGAPTPLISVAPSTLTGFTYEEGSGPSTEQSFSISGSNLDGNAIITAPMNYQISSSSGSGFVTSLQIDQVAGTVDATTIYVRMIAGLSAGSYNDETIDITSGTASPQLVTLSGNVTTTLPTDGYLVNFDGDGEVKVGYASDTVNLSGLNWELTEVAIGDLVNDWRNGIRSARLRGYGTSSMTMLQDKAGGLGILSFQYRRYGTEAQVEWKVEYSIDAGSNWIQIGPFFTGTADVQTFTEMVNVDGNVCIKISRSEPDVATANKRLNIDDILLTNYNPGGATPTIYTTGNVDPLTNILGNPGEEIGFYHLSSADLVANIAVVAPLYFEIATSEEGPWSSTLSLSPTFNADIYVRMNSDTIGEHSGNITHNSPGATEVSVRVDGETFEAGGTIIVTQNLLPFTQEPGTPSAVQSYTLQGTGLIGPITVNADAPFELSADGSTGWATSLDFAVNYNGPVYIRMNAAAAGTYDDRTIEHLNLNATPDTFMVSGTATPPAGEVANLFFSEYVEGSSSNKALEIYNAEDNAVDLANYKVRLAPNGGVWGNTLELTGTLAAGAVFVIANAGASPAIIALSDVTSDVTYYNGDDALGLFYGEVLIDAIGIQGERPPLGWDVAGVTTATLDHTLIRKATVTQGNTNWPISAGTNADDSEWIVLPQDFIDNLGVHPLDLVPQYTAEPVFNPVGGIFTEPINVSLSCSTENSQIRYTVDGSDPTPEIGTIYLSAISVAQTTTIKAIAYAPGYEPSTVMTQIYTINIQGESPLVHYWNFNADLPAANTNWDQPINATQGSGQLTYSFTQAYSYGGTLINGIDGEVTGGSFVPRGGILAEEVPENNGEYFLLSIPTTGYENIVITYVTQKTTSGFNNQQVVYSLDGTGWIEFTNVTTIPASFGLITLDFSGISGANNNPNFKVKFILTGATTDSGNNRFDNIQVNGTATSGGTLATPVVTIVRNGNNVDLSWTAIPGATSYRIESSDDPYADFTQAGTTNNTAFSITAAAKKFFRVIALP